MRLCNLGLMDLEFGIQGFRVQGWGIHRGWVRVKRVRLGTRAGVKLSSCRRSWAVAPLQELANFENHRYRGDVGPNTPFSLCP